MTGKLSTPKEMKRARRVVSVTPAGNHLHKRLNRRRRRRQEKAAVKEGRYDFLGRGCPAWDVY